MDGSQTLRDLRVSDSGRHESRTGLYGKMMMIKTAMNRESLSRERPQGTSGTTGRARATTPPFTYLILNSDYLNIIPKIVIHSPFGYSISGHAYQSSDEGFQ